MEYCNFSMEQLTNTSKEDAIFILQRGTLRDIRWILAEKCEEWYLKLCEEFGVGFSGNLHVEVTKNFLGFGGRTCYRNLGNLFWSHIIFSAPVIRTIPELVLCEVIPHEVCHAFHLEFFPETHQEAYHGEMWISLMKHCGVEAKKKLVLEDSLFDLIVNHEE